MWAHPDDYAIVIGIDHYPGLDLEVADAAARARQFAAWLTTPEGGGIPPANLSLLLSQPPEAATEPYPKIAHVDRALAAIGGGAGGARAGRRLYACFAGCATGRNADDLALLLADAGPLAPGPTSLGLQVRRDYLRRALPFDEFILIADARPVVCAAETAAPPFALPQWHTSGRQLRELILIGDRVIPALLTEFRVAAEAGAGWQLDAQALTHRLLARMRRNAARRGPPSDLTTQGFVEQVGSIIFGGAASDPATTSSLLVELPHWTAQIRILDRLLRPVQNEVTRSSPDLATATEPGIARVQLPPGDYTVELTLGGTTERRSAIVTPERETRLARGEWTSEGPVVTGDENRPTPRKGQPNILLRRRPKDSSWRFRPGLRRIAAAPLADTTTSRESHRDPAIYYSGQVTWVPKAPAQRGDAGLFIFVRTLEPQDYPGFAEGLALLDSDGNTITDLTGPEVVHNVADGYLAFRALLRPGFYQLRRSERVDREARARLRVQPLYLCANWNTHVFIPAEDAPSLRKLEVAIVPADAGFNPRSQVGAAAQALFEALRTGGPRAAAKLAVSGAMLPQLRQAHVDAPWFAVLGIHALREAADQAKDSHTAEAADIAAELLEGLNARIGDHPDVRALSLQKGERAAEPFVHPPMLRASLALVQQHATHHRNTIPRDSLTDRVLEAGVSNSPWTAWRDLDGLGAISPGETLVRPEPVPVSTGPLSATLTAKAPVFHVLDKAVSQEATNRESAPTVRIEEALSDLQLVPAALRIVAAFGAGRSIPSTVLVPTLAEIASRLLASVKPADLSAATGLPIASVRLGINTLRRAGGLTATDSKSSSALRSASETTAAEVVLEQALRLSAVAQASSASPSSPTIENCARTLLTEAGRIDAALVGERAAAGETITKELRELAQTLCKHADFIATMDADGQLRSVNGVLAAYLAASPDPEAERRELERRLRLPPSTEAPLVLGSDPATAVNLLPAKKVAIKSEGEVRGFVGILRDPSTRHLPATTVPAIEALLTRLTLYSSLLVREATRKENINATREADYMARLKLVVAEIRSLLETPAPADS
jgi:PAS domain-containing protein